MNNSSTVSVSNTPADHPPAHPATQRQKIVWAVLLIAMTFFLLLIARGAVSRLNEAFMRETRVDWRPSDGATLKSGPAAFWYDADKGQLVYQGALDDKRKFDLINLLILDKPDPTAGKSYWAAIDKLAYQANAYGNGLLIDLLVLGGLAGALGVQL